MKHPLILSVALVVGTSLGGIAFAQGAATPDTTAPPAQSKHAVPEQMQQPADSGMQQPIVAAPSDQTQAPKLSSDTVKVAQQELKAEGLYNGMIDGRIGPQTQAAVRQFQQQNGLKTTAMLDQDTLRRLMSQHPHG
jgi:peptidoglycan hydrolase-like protein with peptidoglycan-binding domain